MNWWKQIVELESCWLSTEGRGLDCRECMDDSHELAAASDERVMSNKMILGQCTPGVRQAAT